MRGELLFNGFHSPFVSVKLLKNEISNVIDKRVLRLFEKRAQKTFLKTKHNNRRVRSTLVDEAEEDVIKFKPM